MRNPPSQSFRLHLITARQVGATNAKRFRIYSIPRNSRVLESWIGPEQKNMPIVISDRFQCKKGEPTPFPLSFLPSRCSAFRLDRKMGCFKMVGVFNREEAVRKGPSTRRAWGAFSGRYCGPGGFDSTPSELINFSGIFPG